MKNLSILEPQIEKHYAYKEKTCIFFEIEFWKMEFGKIFAALIFQMVDFAKIFAALIFVDNGQIQQKLVP